MAHTNITGMRWVGLDGARGQGRVRAIVQRVGVQARGPAAGGARGPHPGRLRLRVPHVRPRARGEVELRPHDAARRLAAHAMYPTGANGATQAIIDAETLGGFLERQVGCSARPDWAAALAGYQDQRLPATAQIVRVNRSTGPDSVLQMVEDRAPDGFENIKDVCSKEELEGVGLRYKTLTHALKDIVNEKAKLTESLAERFNGYSMQCTQPCPRLRDPS